MRDGFVHAVAYVRQFIVNASPKDLLAAMGETDLESPPIPERFQRLVDYEDMSSAHYRSLRPKDD